MHVYGCKSYNRVRLHLLIGQSTALDARPRCFSGIMSSQCKNYTRLELRRCGGQYGTNESCCPTRRNDRLPRERQVCFFTRCTTSGKKVAPLPRASSSIHEIVHASRSHSGRHCVLQLRLLYSSRTGLRAPPLKPVVCCLSCPAEATPASSPC